MSVVGGGFSIGSWGALSSTAGAAVPLDIPTIAFVSKTATQVVISHTVPANVTNYSVTRIYYGQSGSSPSQTTSSATENLTFSGLTANTRYVFYAVSESADGGQLAGAGAITVITSDDGSALVSTVRTPHDLRSVSRDSFEMDVELREFLNTHGRYAFLRQATPQLSSTKDDDTGESDIEDPATSSLGYRYVDRKILTYRWAPTQPTGGAYRLNTTNFGAISVDESVFYVDTLNSCIHPSVHDQIVECITDRKGYLVQPYKIQRLWQVNEVIDYRELGGNIAYYAMRCRRVEVAK